MAILLEPHMMGTTSIRLGDFLRIRWLAGTCAKVRLACLCPVALAVRLLLELVIGGVSTNLRISLRSEIFARRGNACINGGGCRLIQATIVA